MLLNVCYKRRWIGFYDLIAVYEFSIRVIDVRYLRLQIKQYCAGTDERLKIVFALWRNVLTYNW